MMDDLDDLLNGLLNNNNNEHNHRNVNNVTSDLDELLNGLLDSDSSVLDIPKHDSKNNELVSPLSKSFPDVQNSNHFSEQRTDMHVSETKFCVVNMDENIQFVDSLIITFVPRKRKLDHDHTVNNLDFSSSSFPSKVSNKIPNPASIHDFFQFLSWKSSAQKSTKKQPSQSKAKRFAVKGTGRIFFGVSDAASGLYTSASIPESLPDATLAATTGSMKVQENKVSSSNKDKVVTTKNDSSNSNGNKGANANNNNNNNNNNKHSDAEAVWLANATRALNVGREGAIAKMAALGEAWADEEELPSLMASSSLGEKGGGNGSGNGNGNGESIPIHLRKEVAIANQRTQKLKIAKKNSKY